MSDSFVLETTTPGVIDDTIHGNCGGGALHANATTSVAGFMSSTDKTKLDGVATGAAALTSAAPANVTKAAAAVGVDTTAARSDHKHDVTTAVAVAVGTANAEGSATSLARSDHTHQVTGLVIPSQVQGDILYFNGTAWVRLAPGTSGQFLRTNGTGANPAWAASSSLPTNYLYAASEARSTTTSTTFQSKVTLATGTQTGTFRIAWTALLDVSDTTYNIEVRLWDNTNSVMIGSLMVLQPHDAVNREASGQFINVTFTAQARDLRLQYRSTNNSGTAGIAAARIEFWRVS